MATYLVTGPLAVVKDRAGKIGYYYTGATLPTETSPDVLRRLTRLGLVSRVTDPPVTVVDRDDTGDGASIAAPTQPPEETEDLAPLPERPAQVAAKGTWVEYAVARGMTREQAESMTKQELIDAYPPD